MNPDIKITVRHDRAYLDGYSVNGRLWLRDNNHDVRLEGRPSIDKDLIKDIVKDLEAAGLKVEVS